MSSINLTKEIHLVVFVHGLWGNPSHLQYFVDQFAEKHGGGKVHILNAKSNSSEFTYDGVDVCGDRLVEEINTEVKFLQDEAKVTKFSIIGYSLGGLISRYAIGVLYQRGFFTSIKPMLFTTFATPHLGIRREDDRTFTKLTNWFSATLLSKTGEQLTFMDKFEGDEPILLTLSRPDKIFFKALSVFKYRKIYANTRNDRTVPFWTAAISEIDPFEDFDELKIVTNEKFKNIIESISKVEIKPKASVMQTIKKVMRSVLISVAIPILIPLWIILVLSTVTVQGILSRRRVQKILATKIKSSNNDDYNLSNHIGISVRAGGIEDEAVETAMNLKNFLTSSPNSATTSNLNPFENATQISEFTTSSQFPHIKICQAQCEAFANLNKLKWDKIAVFLDAFNAHAAIVMRNRFQTKGKEIIKHFIEETFIV